MAYFDTNIQNYTVADLESLLGLQELTPAAIDSAIAEYMAQVGGGGGSDRDGALTAFLLAAKAKLLKSLADAQTSTWSSEQYLTQDDPQQNARVTQRANRVKVSGDEYPQMKRERLGVATNYSVNVAQGTINPNLKNTSTQIVCVDSQFRENNVPALKGLDYAEVADITGTPHPTSVWSSTSFSLNLSEPLTNVISLKLYSFQIPYNWYNIDVNSGNNCFFVREYNDPENPGTAQKIAVPSGNYTAATLGTAVNTALDAAVGVGVLVVNPVDPATGKLGVTNTGPDTYQFVFYNYGAALGDEAGCGACGGQGKINSSLGWALGFRDPTVVLGAGTTQSADTLPDLYGPRYLMLMVDDYSTNRVNKGLVTIQDLEQKLSLPKYYQPGIETVTADGQVSVARPTCSSNAAEVPSTSSGGAGFPIPELVPNQFYTAGNPPSITQNQVYSLNEILRSRKNSPNIKVAPPSTKDVFALIPIRKNFLTFGESVLTEQDSTTTFNRRQYFGPVDIDKLKVSLIDDKGRVVNLNGGDWSFSMIAERLYQY